MSLLGSIENLQQASVSKRKIVLVISVALIMALVIGIWILQLRYPTSGFDSTTSIKAPFGILWNSAKENIKSGFGTQ